MLLQNFWVDIHFVAETIMARIITLNHVEVRLWIFRKPLLLFFTFALLIFTQLVLNYFARQFSQNRFGLLPRWDSQDVSQIFNIFLALCNLIRLQHQVRLWLGVIRPFMLTFLLQDLILVIGRDQFARTFFLNWLMVNIKLQKLVLRVLGLILRLRTTSQPFKHICQWALRH